MNLARLAIVSALGFAVACGRTTLGDALLDSNDDAGDDGSQGGATGDDDGRNGGNGASSGQSGFGGTGAGGNSTGGMAGQLTGGSGGASSGGRAGMAGMAGMSTRCGDGIVGQDEACDPGENPTPPALELRQGAVRRAVQPLLGSASANEFYAYRSRSGHTGFEGAGLSRIFLYRWRPEAAMSLVMHHGIDEDSSGITQEDASVTFEFAGLPNTGVVALSDDDIELARVTPTTARADWNFRTNTDGGVIAGLPFPGTWHLTITPVLFRSIVAWTFFSGAEGDLAVGAEVELDLTQPVEIVATDGPATCRADCTVPRCGDGLLDPGEICDDGNAQPGDGCASCQPEL